MELYTSAHVKVVFEHTPGDKGSKHKETKFYLEVDPKMDKEQYEKKDGTITAAGVKVVTENFVQGLIANIHYSHQAGIKDSAEHLREIIRKLEDGFVRVCDVDKSTFEG